MARRTSPAAARLGGLLLVCGCLVLAGPAARAQAVGMPQLGSVEGMSGVPVGQPPPSATAARPPPVGLPGARPKAAPAPPTQPAASMNPTDALFDAINRGDLAAAQDAIGRGADLNGTNVLGMTPVQLSIDLGHNDITFLLLSAGGGGSAQPTQAAGHGQPSAKVAHSGVVRSGVTRSATLARNSERLRARPTHTAMVAPAPMQSPRLFAGDGGSPIPSAGFLGFGSGR